MIRQNRLAGADDGEVYRFAGHLYVLAALCCYRELTVFHRAGIGEILAEMGTA